MFQINNVVKKRNKKTFKIKTFFKVKVQHYVETTSSCELCMLLFREIVGKLFRSMPSGRQRDSWVVTLSDFVYPREVSPAVVTRYSWLGWRLGRKLHENGNFVYVREVTPAVVSLG